MCVATGPMIATEAWIRNESDAKAAHAGYRFNITRGAYTVWWIERYCTLYEGEWAGEPMRLHGSAIVDEDFSIDRQELWFGGFDGKQEDEETIRRAEQRTQAYQEEFATGSHVDWQYEVTMRLFGWEKWSERWQRFVRRFQKASVWVPKKNKKSPTLAGYAMYLTAGDGEQGQHVYFGAKDGTQARDIVGGHAVAMWEQSPELQAVFGINRNRMRLIHEKSRSYMQPLSSANTRSKEAKEGLNGSLLIDETHVVDKDFMARLKRMGVSRSEPFQIEFSTAGDDPECYGKAQYDRGKLIEAGAVTDHRFFFAAYEAPAKLTDAELAADPLKYGRIANPAWEHTIDPEEFLADYETSRAAGKWEFGRFKMYRLCHWLQGGEPWLRLEDWQKGKRDFSDEDFVGRECWSALDYARTRDLVALCLAFPEQGDQIAFLWWFWLPEQYARDNADKAPFVDAADDPACHLILIPGEVIEPHYIKATLHELHKHYKIRELAYDDWNAENLTMEISEGTRDEHGKIVSSGLGIERHAFSQGIKQFNEPTQEFEKRVIKGEILHNGNQFIEWQVQHAVLREDANGNIKPRKPKRDSVLKVDGLITSVMAMQRAIAAPRPRIYPSQGIRTL